MTIVVFVIIAAAFTVIRAVALAGQLGGEIPWRTVAVNAGGALVLGVLSSIGTWDHPWIVTTAGLGSLTTFSTIAAETANLIDDGHKRTAIAYVGITLVVGIAAAWIGLSIGESA